MRKLNAVLVYGSVSMIIVLAVPMCLFLGAIMIVWNITDKLVRRLEKRKRPVP